MKKSEVERMADLITSLVFHSCEVVKLLAIKELAPALLEKSDEGTDKDVEDHVRLNIEASVEIGMILGSNCDEDLDDGPEVDETEADKWIN